MISLSGKIFAGYSIHPTLEEGMATNSSILAWGIPWTEEPGGLWSMGSKESDTTQVLGKIIKLS